MKDVINRRGNRHLRKLLFYMIRTMITLRHKGNNHIVDDYDKLKTQLQRKPHKVACIALLGLLQNRYNFKTNDRGVFTFFNDLFKGFYQSERNPTKNNNFFKM